jgi:hypothetical protein
MEIGFLGSKTYYINYKVQCVHIDTNLVDWVNDLGVTATVDLVPEKGCLFRGKPLWQKGGVKINKLRAKDPDVAPPDSGNRFGFTVLACDLQGTELGCCESELW